MNIVSEITYFLHVGKNEMEVFVEYLWDGSLDGEFGTAAGILLGSVA